MPSAGAFVEVWLAALVVFAPPDCVLGFKVAEPVRDDDGDGGGADTPCAMLVFGVAVPSLLAAFW